MEKRDIELTTKDGLKIRGSMWDINKPRGLLLWVHGFAEHHARYAHFASAVNRAGLAFAAIDVRGHGISDGKRGFINSFEEYFFDIDSFLHWAEEQKEREGYPVILGCHSHGGLINGRYLESASEMITKNITAAVFTGPFLGLGMPVPGWKKSLASFFSGIVPSLAVPTGLSPELLSHDQSIVKAYAEDPMVFTSATARWFTEILKHHELVIQEAEKIKLPVLVAQGMQDQVVDPIASRKFYEGLGSEDKHWIGYDNMYHEILNETEKEGVYNDILNWIQKKI